MQNRKEYNYSLFLVAFVDVLGQRPRIRELTMPHNEIELQKTKDQLRETAGVIIKFREMFESAFENSIKPTEVINQVPEEKRQEFLSYRKSQIQFRGISDSIIITVPLSNNDENCTPMNGIYPCLFSLCTVFLAMLASKQPIRGGVDIGPCLTLSDTEVYGAALERAYYLESQIADYPRIVVGKELLDYLVTVESQPPKSPYGVFAIKNANNARKLIAMDTDNRLFLDYLGEGIKSIIEISEEARPVEVFNAAEQFVVDRLGYYYSRDDKLYKKYHQVFKYMSIRKSDFLAKPEKQDNQA